MLKRFYQWYKSRTGFNKWVLMFVLNWFYWCIVYGITKLILGDKEEHPVAAFLFQTTFMAIFWTLVFDAWLSPIIKKKYVVKSQSDSK